MEGEQNQCVLRFDRVTVQLDEVKALDEVSFEMTRGETRILFGAAGSGKTVLLKTALGLLRPTSGRVVVFGQDISRMREQELFGIRGRMGVLFQEGGLFDSLNVEENVAYPLVNQPALRLAPDEARGRAQEALRFVELEHAMEKFPSEISGGMRRRVGIARAVVTGPELVLYDSPTAGLDPITAYTIVSLAVKERTLRSTTTVMATHRYQDGHLLATARFDPATGLLAPADGNGGPERPTRFMVLKEGRLVFDGTMAEMEASRDAYVSKFVRREN